MQRKNLPFVDLEKLSPSIIFDLRYASENNFTGKKIYPVARCFLREKVARKIARIQEKVQKRGLGLKIFDGYRPLSVQKIFWEFVPDTRYIADPKVGSRHNRGAAIDLTLVDKNCHELLMPTDYDDFTEIAHRDYMDLPKEIVANRQLLEDFMAEEGFVGLPTEWWHFDDAQWQDYPVEDIPLENMPAFEQVAS